MKDLKRRRSATFKPTSPEYLEKNLEEVRVPQSGAEKSDMPSTPAKRAKKDVSKVVLNDVETVGGKPKTARFELVISPENQIALDYVSAKYPDLTFDELFKSLVYRLHGQVREAIAAGEISSLPPVGVARTTVLNKIVVSTKVSASDMAKMFDEIDPLRLRSVKAVVTECYLRVWNAELQKLASR